MSDLRSSIAGQVRGWVGSGEINLTRPPGDDGLFGPGSAAWDVHGDFTAMMIGGISALLLQMLHPGALAGVWDHSDVRGDMSGRLKRTAQFLSITTFGSTAAAEAMIARVRAVHDRVTGTLPDGTPYSASDPDLLAWVHVAEADSFLRAHLRYKDPLMPRARQDRYFEEMARVAAKLGAPDVPRSRHAAERYLEAMRPALRFDARTRAVQEAVLRQRSPHAALAPATTLMLQAGVDMLPAWARAMHRLDVPLPGRPVVRLGALGVGRVLRWALSG